MHCGCLMATDHEMQCFLALDALQLTMQPGESALTAVLRHLATADPIIRPYRYEQADGMRAAYQAWLDLGGRGDLNTFQAGYTLGVNRG